MKLLAINDKRCMSLDAQHSQDQRMTSATSDRVKNDRANNNISTAKKDDLGITSLAQSHIQTTSPQPAYAVNAQSTNFVTSHMLGQSYATDNSNFGPIYHHHHNSHHHTGLPYSYEKYKMPPSPSTNVYQHYQGFYGHQIRQVEYIPR
ncbi:CLUMA_CG008509, isoform A [Clunio marinus]|uniref:CLUMA_CG008509, isoform A n=1 Tax=Clunio marinus TaxID=568069 RepID=A0A1J1I3V5_9DIPT|nr:CLUMA_CG008509, isoform A [Clunio marinus]